MGEQAPLPVFTIGHSTRSIADFVALLRAGGADRVVDVRTVPRSRTNPQYNEDRLPAELEPYQIGHTRIAELGGFRKAASAIPAEVNGWWTNRSFHNYADYALSDQFAAGLDRLLGLAAEQSCAIMCSEAVWWRCHRRLIADWLMVRGREVFHLLGDDRVDPARMTPAAVVEGGVVTYPAVDSPPCKGGDGGG